MTESRFRVALQDFLARRPFSPFIIELNNGHFIEITHPEVGQEREGTITFHPIEDTSRPHDFDHTSVSIVYGRKPPQRPAETEE